MAFLREIGPDTLIPCFAVNLKGNKDVATCNMINDYVFKHLVHTDEDMSAQRTPMIVTASTMSHHRHSNALNHFKTRLGVRLPRWKMRGFPPGSVVPFENTHIFELAWNSTATLGIFGCTETFECQETIWAAMCSLATGRYTHKGPLAVFGWVGGRKNRYNAGKKSWHIWPLLTTSPYPLPSLLYNVDYVLKVPPLKKHMVTGTNDPFSSSLNKGRSLKHSNSLRCTRDFWPED